MNQQMKFCDSGDGVRTRSLIRLLDVNLCNRIALVQHHMAVSTRLVSNSHLGAPLRVRMVVQFVWQHLPCGSSDWSSGILQEFATKRNDIFVFFSETLVFF